MAETKCHVCLGLGKVYTFVLDYTGPHHEWDPCPECRRPPVLAPSLLSPAVAAMAQKDADERAGYDRESGRYTDDPPTPRQLRDSANRPWDE